MFTALYFKEWREKALVFVFALGLLVLLLGAQFFVQNKDLREWLVYAVLLLYFPLAALLLGAAGFEAEYRQGAWAYLFSRPVSRIAIWLAKFGAVMSMFTVLWLVFIGAWAAFPAIRSLAAGPREILEYIVADGFPWWSLGLSLFLIIVAFSLSILHERQLQLMFLSLVLGLFLVAAAWMSTISKAAGFMAWLDPGRALRTLLIGLVLMAFAFIGASLSTLVRSDFSQPRHRTRTYVALVRSFADPGPGHNRRDGPLGPDAGGISSVHFRFLRWQGVLQHRAGDLFLRLDIRPSPAADGIQAPHLFWRDAIGGPLGLLDFH